MVRPKNQIIWRHYRKTENKSATCNYCEKIYTVANLQKMARHLLKCLNCPENCKQPIRTNSWKNSGSAGSDVLLQPLRDNQNLRPRSELSSAIEGRTSSTTVFDLSNDLSNTEKENLHSLLAKAIYVSGTHLSIVEHPLWRIFLNQLQPLYKLPTRKTISTTILDKTYREMHRELKEEITSQTCLHLMLDGWSNCRNEGIINILIAKPEPVFVKSIATADNRQTSNYICEQISSVLSEYGVNKFATVIADNASNMQRALRLIKEIHPNITGLNCTAHTLHLLCKNIIRIDVINACKEMTTNLIKTIKKSQVLSSLLAKIVKEKNVGESLKLPCDTRWGSHYTSFRSVENTKVALQTLAVHERATLLPAEEKSALLDDTFWEIIRQCKIIMEPISKAILKLESNETNAHRVFLTLKDMKSKLLFALPDITILDDDKKEEILITTDTRINMCLKPIHFAAYLLDPTAQGSELDERQEMDAMELEARDGFWSKRFLWENINDVSATTWWKGLCGKTALSKVAVRILTAPCTSAAVERSFSAHNNIHSQKRNRLTTERAAKLTYITYNWNLLHKNEDNKIEDCVSNSLLVSQEHTETTPPRTVSPEPSTSGINTHNFEFLDCHNISASSDDDD